MIDFINTYSAELISTGTILAAIAVPFAKRIVSDKNMLDVFNKAKESIKESNNIKVDIVGTLATISNRVDKMEKQSVEQTAEFERVILEFQESDLYNKMLLSAEQIDSIHQTLQQKDETISMLGQTIKSLEKNIQEIKNALKG